MANGEISYSGPRMADASLVTRDEIQGGKVKAPEGTAPYTVQPGDNLSTIATQHGYGSPPDMKKFYADNQQYADRDHDLIYPGEQVFVRAPENGTTATGKTDPKTNEPLYQNYKNGQPTGEPYPATAAPNGQPANSVVVDQDGREVRTDKQGNAANGYFAVDGNNSGVRYQEFKDGVPVEGKTISVSANETPRKLDEKTGALLNGTVPETREQGENSGKYRSFQVTYENGVEVSRKSNGGMLLE